jgi:hypothetical protein
MTLHSGIGQAACRDKITAIRELSLRPSDAEARVEIENDAPVKQKVMHQTRHVVLNRYNAREFYKIQTAGT